MVFQILIHKIIGKFLYRFYPYLPSKTAVKLKYYYCFGRKLDLNNPRSYNEKLQWLKLYDKHPEYSQLVDKIEAKKYVANIIGDKYIIPTLNVYEKVEDIDWDKLPNQFVLKTNHGCGRMIICKDKSKLNIGEEKKMLRTALRQYYSRWNNEYPYRFVHRRMLLEPYMEDETGELRDFKFLCFDGEPYCLFVATDRGKKDVETKFDFYDMDWNFLSFTNGHPNSGRLILPPQHFDEMKEIARKLSKGFPHIRVDLYNINGTIYFGELTLFHWSGLKPFVPERWDYILGEKIHLPLNNRQNEQ